MSPSATVLIPTHDHGPTLRYAVGSVLAQTVEDLELFIVGDGVPDVTREIAAELCAADERVRFFDNPKGPRHGELHRHAALAEARGRVVAYLSDDDLWFPDHLAAVCARLEDASFTHTMPVNIARDGSLSLSMLDLGRPRHRELILGGETGPSLSTGAHTLALYRTLPHGWRTTPKGTYTDVHMWRQILEHPDCVAATISRPTVIHLAAASRGDMTLDERLEELEDWAQALTDPDRRRRFVEDVLAVTLDEARWWMDHDDHVTRWGQSLEAQLRTAHEATPAAAPAPQDDALAELDRVLGQGVVTSWDAASKFGAPGRRARALLHRGLQPMLVRQREIDHTLGSATQALHASVAALEGRLSELEGDRDALAQQVAELRAGVEGALPRAEGEAVLGDLRSLALPGAERALRPGRHGGGGPRKVLCSMAVGPHVDLLAVSSVTFEAYAARHGYDLHLTTELPEPSRPPSWNKLPILRGLLDDYELVLWIDPDAVIVDVQHDIAAAVHPGKDLYMVEHRWPGDKLRSANAGVMLLRSSDWTRALIDHAWTMDQYVDHAWWENAALLEMLGYAVPADLSPPYKVAETEWSARLELLGLEWNSTAGESVAPHPYIRHFGRPATTEQRRESLLEGLRAFRRSIAEATAPR